MKSKMLKAALFTLCLSGIHASFCFGQTDNQELAELYRTDQSDRQRGGNPNMDIDYWSQVQSRDSARLARVYQLSNLKKLITGQDYYHAAMICQHGPSIRDSDAAISFMRKAIELDTAINPWLLAAAIDRNLVRRGKPQIYGTQFYTDEKNVTVRCLMDTTIISDEERKKFHVETLQEQREKLKQFNKISLFQLLEELKDVKQLELFCRKEWLNKDKSKYNLSESELNDLGYYLMSTSKYSEAYIIFLLNTELYPNAFNTYDSLGECLLKLGKVEEGLAAYKKSLALNPGNQNAKNVLAGY
jgi:tetratricopeptide (TPR) repeat protein